MVTKMSLVLVKTSLLLLPILTSLVDAKSVASADSAESLEDNKGTGTTGKFVKDPFIFYKWPGFGLAEGLHGRLPWYPAYANPEYPVVWVEKTAKDRKKEQKVKEEEEDDEPEDDEEEEDDEPEDDLDLGGRYYHKPSTYKPWRRPQRPVGVSSFGISPPTDERATWYGVLRPKVRSGLLEESDEMDSPAVVDFDSEPKRILRRRLYRIPANPYWRHQIREYDLSQYIL